MFLFSAGVVAGTWGADFVAATARSARSPALGYGRAIRAGKKKADREDRPGKF
jgi:hypothetical protein